jgi:phenylalanine-4-hydroxylase
VTWTLHAPSIVPWFPLRISDIDKFSTKTLDAGSELESDHPGFADPG